MAAAFYIEALQAGFLLLSGEKKCSILQGVSS
jgi:hypothetical protein